MPRLPALRLLAAAALLALAGCAPDAPAAAPGRSDASPDDAGRLQSLVGEARCESDDQCRTVGWGHKACGGPQRWVAYSTLGTDVPALERLAREHAERQRAEQERGGMVSNCAYVPDPGARCVAQRCQTVPGAPAAR